MDSSIAASCSSGSVIKSLTNIRQISSSCCASAEPDCAAFRSQSIPRRRTFGMSDSFLFSAGSGFPSALCDLSIIEERGHLLALQSHRSKCRRRRPSPRLRLLVHQEHLNVENGETALLRHLWISQCLLSFHSTRFRFLPKRKPKRSPSTPAKMSRPASPTTTRRRRRNRVRQPRPK